MGFHREISCRNGCTPGRSYTSPLQADRQSQGCSVHVENRVMKWVLLIVQLIDCTVGTTSHCSWLRSSRWSVLRVAQAFLQFSTSVFFDRMTESRGQARGRSVCADLGYHCFLFRPAGYPDDCICRIQLNSSSDRY